jgi:formate hydrogenlyase subunit 3/multisubunit Na+/H+ antiporter MnhD subunit
MDEVNISYLPVIAVLSPMLLSILVRYIGGKSEKARDILSIAISVGAFLAVVAMAPAVLGGKVIEFVPIIIKAYFGANEYEGGYDDAPPSMLVPMAILAAGCIVFGLFPHLTFSAIIPAAEALLAL